MATHIDTALPLSKRRRVTRACDNCKSRKRKCNGEKPCSYCDEHRALCTYDAPYTRGRPERPEPQGSPLSRNAPTSPRSLSRWPHSGRNPVALTAKDALRSPHNNNSRWPHASLDQVQVSTLEDEEHGGTQSSRARSPIGGEGAAPMGQYLGPTSPFSFIRRASRRFGNLNAVSTASTSGETKPGVSIFSMGDRQFPKVEAHSSLLSEAEGHIFVNRYFDFAMATYRFLHQPTVLKWHKRLHEDERNQTNTLQPMRRAILLLVFATGTLYNVDDTHAVLPDSAPEDLRLTGERYYRAAQKIIATEQGAAQLDSVQARLASTLYLLTTSRPNQAWHLFGTTCQLIVALGLHRRTPRIQEDYVLSECRKRSYWTAYTLDGYLSVMLGRPPFLNEEYADQDYPQPLNDSDITQIATSKQSKGIDCLITASILHAKLARVVRQASKDQYLLHQSSELKQILTAANLNEEIAKWQDELPIFLSGAINPASLIPVFRRQVTVLRMGCAHAIMLVNRPLILSRTASSKDIQPHVEECLSAAKQVLELVLDFVADNHMFQGFWTTQYVTFNALSIVYVWIIQRKIGRLANVISQYEEPKMFSLAEAVQSHLATATHDNAPNLRYSIILGELQREAERVINSSSQATSSGDPGTSSSSDPQTDPASASDQPLALGSDWDMGSMDFPLDPNLWMQLDSFPFSMYMALADQRYFGNTADWRGTANDLFHQDDYTLAHGNHIEAAM